MRRLRILTLRYLTPRFLTLGRLRRLAGTRPVARVLLGLAAAFVCGVALGVGVAAVFTPESAGTAARMAGAAGQGAGQAAGMQRKDADEAPYAVEVKVRQEGQEGKSPAPVATPAAGDKQPQGAAPANPPADPPATTPATPPDTAPAALPGAGVRLVAKPVEQPPAAETGADLSGAVAPPAVPRDRPAGEAEPHAQAALPETPAAAAPAANDEAALVAAPPSVPQAAGESQAPADHTEMQSGAAAAAGEAPAQGVEAAVPPHPVPKNLELAALPMPGGAAWIRNAVKLPDAPRDVVIAVIIDDMGIDQKRSKLAIGLPAPLTLSFIPYGYHLKELVAASREAGHEIMLHMPMEPMDPDADPGLNALRTTVPLEENHRRLLWALSRFEGFVGLNNHMGSKFTAWKPGMEMVMREVQARGLLFVDSFTNNESVGYALARQHRLPSASRDVFIDHDITRAAIDHSLKELEKIARRRGYAVGIAHPHDLTREMLKTWIIDAKSRGIDFVPISNIAQRGMKTG